MVLASWPKILLRRILPSASPVGSTTAIFQLPVEIQGLATRLTRAYETVLGVFDGSRRKLTSYVAVDTEVSFR